MNSLLVIFRNWNNISTTSVVMQRGKFNSWNVRKRFTQGRNAGIFGFGNTAEDTQSESSGSQRGGRGRPRGKHPAGLKGKEIGLWYARRGGAGKKKQEIQQLVAMDDSKTKRIENLLLNLREEPAAAFPTFQAMRESPISRFKTQYMQHINEDKSIDKGDEGLDNSHLIKDNAFDNRLLTAFKNKKSPKYSQMQDYRKRLPAYSKLEEILNTVENNQTVVIVGETGCGKTTQVPQFILDSYIKSERASQCHIICTQPRRISAISVAERVAEERDEICGNETVGYHIRLENKIPPEKGSIMFCTTGMVLQYLNGDPNLSKVSHLILDEVHERDLHTDFLMTIVKDLLCRRPNLKLILMSATLNAEKFSKYFGNCPMLNIPGFTYPVKEYYLEDVLQVTNYSVSSLNYKTPTWKQRAQRRENPDEYASTMEYEQLREPFLRQLIENGYSPKTIQSLRNINEDDIDAELMKQLIKYICTSQPEGAILVFLPGWTHISKLNSLLTEDPFYSSRNHLIIPLHSMMPTINQREVFERPRKGVRKIILATNIAETSITINDVVYVVDCGKIKITNYNVIKNMATLKPQWVSLANAKQRRGRAGRVQPGVCYHLYSKVRENILDAYQLPEIQRTRLETLCLQIKMLKLGRIQTFLSKTMDPPLDLAIDTAVKMLMKLNALDEEENLTPLGYHLAKLPLDPQTGKMILFGAIFGCLDPILTVAASLDFKDAFYCPLGLEKKADLRKKVLAEGFNSDHIMLAKAYQGWEAAKRRGNDFHYCRENFLSKNTLQMLEKMRGQLAEHLYDVKLINSANPKSMEANRNSDNMRLIQAIVCAGLYPNVAKLTIRESTANRPNNRNRPPAMRTKEDGKVAFHLKSVNSTQGNFESAWLVYHLKLQSSKIFLHDATIVRPLPLIFFGGKVTFVREGQSDIITVDDYITFHCPETTAKLILKLRQQLDGLLHYKISHPGYTQWDSQSQEGQILQAIVDLITSEKDLTVSRKATGSWVDDEVD